MTPAVAFAPSYLRKNGISPPDRYNSNEQKLWTVAQCSRLLRPIKSRIEAIRKDARHSSAVETGSSKSERGESKPMNPFDHYQISAENKNDKDLEWEFNEKRPRMRRTYGKRKTMRDENREDITGQRIVAGEVSIPTPVLKRTMPNDSATYISSPLAPQFARPEPRGSIRSGYVQNLRFADSRFTQDKRGLRAEIHSNRYAHFEGLYSALETLLKATMPNSLDKCSSQRSLLSTCLRTVPIYIDLEKEWINSETAESKSPWAVNQRDVTVEVYTDLELLGTTAAGWKHLKTVVRAHGIYLIQCIVAGPERLLPQEFTSALILLCLKRSCPDEAALLLSSLLETQYPEPQSSKSRLSDVPAMLPLTTLVTFVTYTKRTDYQFQALSRLFKTGLLPISWLTTLDFRSIWTSVFSSLSSPQSKCGAQAFLYDIIGELSVPVGKKQKLAKSLEATLSSIIRILVTICLLDQSGEELQAPWGLRNLLKSLMIDCSLDSTHETSVKGISLIILSNIILSTGVDGALEENISAGCRLLELIHRKTQQHQFVNSWKANLAQFLCSVARCCGRCSADGGFGQLQAILRCLESLSDKGLPDAYEVLPQIAVDAAVYFSEQLPNEEHIEFARQTRSALLKSSFHAMTPMSISRAKLIPGFRWEEGISEWVTATPARAKDRTSSLSRYSSCGEYATSEDETCKSIKLKKTREMGVVQCELNLVPYSKFMGAQLSDQTSKRMNLDTPPHNYDIIQDTTQYLSDVIDKKSSKPDDDCGRSSKRRRKVVAKGRRFGNRVLSSSQEWRLFIDGSGDEDDFSFITNVESSSEGFRSPSSNSSCEEKATEKPKKKPFDLSEDWRTPGSSSSEGEDELSMQY